MITQIETCKHCLGSECNGPEMGVCDLAEEFLYQVYSGDLTRGNLGRYADRFAPIVKASGCVHMDRFRELLTENVSDPEIVEDINNILSAKI